MNIRILGLVPVFALVAVGAVQAQSNPNANSIGGMAYPQSNPSGQFQVPAPSPQATGGNMAYPSSTGGVAATPPSGPGIGNMAYPAGRPLQQPTAAGGSTPGALPPSSTR